ncbi:PTPRO phosphatase, partial [Polypterus senegalus]
MALEPNDITASVSGYMINITGESKNYIFEFKDLNGTVPPSLVFNARYHGLYYVLTLMMRSENVTSKPIKSIPVLTKPLPVNWVSIYDYKPSPETGVIFEIKYPEKYNLFTRVNISYLESTEPRSILYKDHNSSDSETSASSDWPHSVTAFSSESEEFINQLVENEYENEMGSAIENDTFQPLQLELRWLPPNPPTAYDGFIIYIVRNGNSSDIVQVDENTHEFFTEIKEPGIYKVSVTTLSSSGMCKSRESISDTSITFYLSPSGEWFEEPKEPPQNVSVHLLSSTIASVSWSQSSESDNRFLLSVLSLTCAKANFNQRMEHHYCSQVNSTSRIIENLTPGAQYQVVVFYKNGPLIGPPSKTVIFGIEPTGVRDLMLYAMEPRLVILSWSRPRNVAFRKYVVDMFYLNPFTLSAEWRTYYEIAGTVSLTSSIRINYLLPAWYYNFRVTMVTWGEPPLSCCNNSTVSFITAPEAPEISSVIYSSNLLYVTWHYGDNTTDLSYSRISHWLVVAEGRKRVRKSITSDAEQLTVNSHVVTFSSLSPSTTYNCSVTSFSHDMSSEPAFIAVSTLVAEMNPNIVVISVLAVLSIFLIGLLLLILIVLRRKHLQMASPVQLDDFDAYLKDMHKDSDYKFSLQFEDLKHIGIDLPHEAAELPVNRTKNRYTNILPYDFSSVKLITIHNSEGSDYINANFIPVKCDHYWPFTEEPVSYGDITVEMTSEKESTEWAIRHFRLCYADETQEVMHLNYTAWPDHGVPNVNAVESILHFVQIVRQQATKSKGPVIVHCSAGVGRTGTFIALDRLMQHIKEHEFVDILGLVAEMRTYRPCMVQTEEQYVFIHHCIQVMWKKKKEQYTASDIIYENVGKS